MDQEQINRFKLRIKNENKENHTSRRRYSKNLKQDIVLFADDNKISSYVLATRIGVSYTAIDNWRRKSKSRFNKITISKSVHKKKR